MAEHKFHIPVMGIGFTVDSPAKVAQYGISSVISMVDDILVEKMRKFYCAKLSVPFEAIEKSVDDFRAKRFTAYLDTVHDVITEQIASIKSSAFEKGSEITKYFEMLPSDSAVKKLYDTMQNSESATDKSALQEELRAQVVPGSIDVNIMTKLDKANYKAGEQLPIEYNDAHAALRGFAKSKIAGSMVFSAGMNSKLYSYMASLKEFFPTADGSITKKIVIKVSDYRSALTQGKFLAKKGLWVSEFRIESGLNCGGHAFASPGNLMGPILDEFRTSRDELIATLKGVFDKACAKKELPQQEQVLPVIITAQGGIGTAEEQKSLLEFFKLDGTGWGSPFLLCPEASNVDEFTFDILAKAKESDLYLSDVSPLGVKFNNIRGNSKEIEKEGWIAEGKPGSTCPKQYLVSNTEYTEKAICTASRLFQKKKIAELDAEGLSKEKRDAAFAKIVDKECICVGLGTSALLNNDLDRRMEGDNVSICPGPNLAYYTEKQTLAAMCDFIYGRKNITVAENRPHLFMKELGMYIDYFKDMISGDSHSDRDIKTFTTFQENLTDGIGYYRAYDDEHISHHSSVVTQFRSDLEGYSADLKALVATYA